MLPIGDDNRSRRSAPVITWLRPWYPDVAQGTYKHDLRRYALYRGWPKDP